MNQKPVKIEKTENKFGRLMTFASSCLLKAKK